MVCGLQLEDATISTGGQVGHELWRNSKLGTWGETTGGVVLQAGYGDTISQMQQPEPALAALQQQLQCGVLKPYQVTQLLLQSDFQDTGGVLGLMWDPQVGWAGSRCRNGKLTCHCLCTQLTQGWRGRRVAFALFLPGTAGSD